MPFLPYCNFIRPASVYCCTFKISLVPHCSQAGGKEDEEEEDDEVNVDNGLLDEVLNKKSGNGNTGNTGNNKNGGNKNGGNNGNNGNGTKQRYN